MLAELLSVLFYQDYGVCADAFLASGEAKTFRSRGLYRHIFLITTNHFGQASLHRRDMRI